MRYLLDTNVVSEVRKASGSASVRGWLSRQSSEDLFVSVLVIGELQQGAERLARRDTAQAARLQAWISELTSHYADRVLPVSAEIALEWGRLNAGDPLPVVDGLLAATARVHALTIVTRNTRDFERSGVALLNPFQELPRGG